MNIETAQRTVTETLEDMSAQGFEMVIRNPLTGEELQLNAIKTLYCNGTMVIRLGDRDIILSEKQGKLCTSNPHWGH
jgi:hypothetical protein